MKSGVIGNTPLNARSHISLNGKRSGAAQSTEE